MVIPAYDRPEYLRQAVESVLGQSMGDLELLVIDDASPRPLRPVVEAFGDPRVDFRRNEQSRGVSGTTRAGAIRARGKYLVILNDDDLWGPSFLQRMVPHLEADEDLVVAFCNFHIVDEDGEVDPDATLAARGHFGRDVLAAGKHHPIVRIAVIDGYIPAVMCALYRRDAIDWSQLPDGAGSAYDRWIAYLAAMTSMAAYYDPSYLTYYRTHAGQQTRTRTLQHFLGRRYCYERFLADPRLAHLRRPLRHRLASECTGCGTVLLRAGDPAAARANLRHSLGLRVTPRAATGYALSLLPASLASSVAAAATKGRAWLLRAAGTPPRRSR